MKSIFLILCLSLIALKCTSQTASSQEDRKFCFNEQQVDSIIVCGFDATANRIALEAVSSANKDLSEVICMKDQLLAQNKNAIQAKDDNERYLERVNSDQLKENKSLEKFNMFWRTVAGVATGVAGVLILKDL